MTKKIQKEVAAPYCKQISEFCENDSDNISCTQNETAGKYKFPYLGFAADHLEVKFIWILV